MTDKDEVKVWMPLWLPLGQFIGLRVCAYIRLQKAKWVCEDRYATDCFSTYDNCQNVTVESEWRRLGQNFWGLVGTCSWEYEGKPHRLIDFPVVVARTPIVMGKWYERMKDLQIEVRERNRNLP